MQPVELKKIILDAQRIREESWLEDNNIHGRHISGRYTLDFLECARRAVTQNNAEISWVYIVYLLNFHAWNDIQNWSVGD